tara:strand:- start:482 stop:1648 length:1167 start_codon:yes stop_codon:yes gene_type:complete
MANKIEWEPFADGETISATKIAQTNASIQNRINALQVDDIAEESLTREHITASPIRNRYTISNNSIAEMTIISDKTHSYPGFPVYRMPTTDWLDEVPMGWDPSGPHHWRTNITHSEAECPVDFTERGKQLFVMANIHVTQLYVEYSSSEYGTMEEIEKDDDDDEGMWGVTVTASKLTGHSPHIYGFFMICLVDEARNLYPVPKTLRYIDSDTNTNTGRDMAEEDREKFEVARGEVEGDTGTFFKPERDQKNGLPRVHKDVPIRSMIRHEDILPTNDAVPHTIPKKFVAARFVASVLRNDVMMYGDDEAKMHISASRISAFVPDMVWTGANEPDKKQVSPNRAFGTVTMGGGGVTLPATDPLVDIVDGDTDTDDTIVSVGGVGISYTPS